MSLLYKHINGDLILDDETYFKEGFNSIISNKYPIGVQENKVNKNKKAYIFIYIKCKKFNFY